MPEGSTVVVDRGLAYAENIAEIRQRKSQLSGYKSNKFNWLGKCGSGSCDFDSPNA
jgi:hypothetical protein